MYSASALLLSARSLVILFAVYFQIKDTSIANQRIQFSYN